MQLKSPEIAWPKAGLERNAQMMSSDFKIDLIKGLERLGISAAIKE